MYQFYPLLLCLLPAHSIYGENFSEVSLKNYLFAIPIITGFTLLSITGLNHLTQNILLANLIFCFNFFAIIYAKFVFMANFSKYKRSIFKYQIGFIIGYIVCCAIISTIVIKLARFLPLEFISKVLFWGSLVISFFIVTDIIKKVLTFKQSAIESPVVQFSEQKNLPDIYHILADAHTGFALPEFCDDNFKTELEKRGFTIYKNAKSNYTQTNWSVPSMFSMDYIENIVEGEGKNKNIYPSFKALSKYGDNPWFNTLKKNNYRLFFSVTKPFHHLVRHFSSKKNLELKLTNRIIETIFSTSIFAVRPFFFTKRNPEKYLFNLLKNFKKQCTTPNEHPKYCFTHFLAPHRPYLFDENGNRKSKAETRDEKNYFSYQKYINKQLLKLIDEITPQIKENSIILLHSDHAHGGNLNSRHNILLAIKFPKNYNPECIKDDITLVNLFKGLQKEIFNENKEFSENKYYVCCASEILPLEHLQNKNNYQITRLEANNFTQQLKKLKQKYRNKKIVLYGAGVFFQSIQNNYDLSGLNIIAISDSKFDKYTTPTFDKELGLDKISPFNINTLNPDIVLISVLEDVNIEKYFNETLFKIPNCKFKYDSLFKSTLETKIMEELI